MADGNARKFTMIQLIVVLGILLFILGLLLPIRRDRGGESSRIKCSSNLRQIGLAMMMYANSETRTASFPRTRYSVSDADRPTAYTRPAATQPFADDGPGPNDVTAPLWLLLRTQEITTDVLVCPTATTTTRVEFEWGRDANSFSNFVSQTNLGYSLQNPYPSEAAVKAGFAWSDKLPADFAIAADINPGAAAITRVTFTSGGKDQRTANSPNHQFDGQNVLYADGHVDWTASVWAGVKQDNIYGFGLSKNDERASTPIGIVGSPADAEDSVLLPIWDPKVPMPGSP